MNSKDLIQIVMAHHVPYAATASVANIPDLRRKVEKARDIRGCRVLHIMSPCPTGWGYSPAKTVEVAREAINSGAWVLLEYENGKITLGKRPSDLGTWKDTFLSRNASGTPEKKPSAAPGNISGSAMPGSRRCPACDRRDMAVSGFGHLSGCEASGPEEACK